MTPTGSPTGQEEAAAVVRGALADGDLDWKESAEGVFDVVLPGERKLQTPVRLEVGPHALAVHAFVCRRPDENHEAVYRWMLERNMRLYAVGFALDAVGDVFLDGRLPLAAVTVDEIDRLLGSVLAAADESFNVLLSLGFTSSIRREWAWRNANGESTANLAAFRGWLERDEDPVAPEA